MFVDFNHIIIIIVIIISHSHFDFLDVTRLYY
jgi:hypothetical protein